MNQKMNGMSQTIEEAALKLYPRLINDPYNPFEDDNKEERDIWIAGAKWKERVDSHQFPKTMSFENPEWVFQFDEDEPISITSSLDGTKEFVIRIGNNNNSNIWFYDGNGKTFKIFAREKK